jgi:uncharacterized membrane protein YkvA (DUF1232 family)
MQATMPPQNTNQERSDAQLVEQDFWPKFLRVARRLPFADELLAAYYAAADSETPSRVRLTLFGALAYFVVPTDLVPDFLLGLGFTDDAAVLFAALKTLSGHILPRHRERARTRLAALDEGNEGSVDRPYASGD